MPRTAKLPILLFWSNNVDGRLYLERFDTIEEAINYWSLSIKCPPPADTEPIQYICIYNPNTGTVTVWPAAPNSVKDPEKVARRWLKKEDRVINRVKELHLEP